MKLKTVSTGLVAGALFLTQAYAQEDQAQPSQQGGAMQQQPSQQSQQQAQQQPSQAAGQLAQNKDAVKQVQQALNKQGYQVGKVDGIYGPKTKDALTKFQTAQGLQANGQIDHQTLSALGFSQSEISAFEKGGTSQEGAQGGTQGGAMQGGSQGGGGSTGGGSQGGGTENGGGM